MKSNLSEKLLRSLEHCEKEILQLRNENSFLNIQVKTMDRILGALESHHPKREMSSLGEDLVWKIRDSKKILEEEIQKERNNEPLVETKRHESKGYDHE